MIDNYPCGVLLSVVLSERLGISRFSANQSSLRQNIEIIFT